ncbi:MAG: hydrogenase maturation protease [Chloroflexi bacterium]|nr:hydrogenase maturation protease [Chloroflexota bacterium]
MEFTESAKPVCHSEEAPILSRRPKNLIQSKGCKAPGDPSLSLRVTGKGSPKVTVLGIGNLLLRDEGVGVHLVQRLAGMVDTAGVELVDGGTSPDIQYLVSGDTDKLIVVDAVDGGDEPGAIYRFTAEDVTQDAAMPVSLHEIGILETLKLMSLRQAKPKPTVIIGIQPKTMDYGLELSPEVERKMPDVINLVLKEIEEASNPLSSDEGREGSLSLRGTVPLCHCEERE